MGASLFFLGCITTWAAGFQIDSTNYPTYLATQEGDFILEGKNITLKSKEQAILIVKTGDIHSTVSMVEFGNLSYTTPGVVLLWKVRGQEYAQANQMQLAIKAGKISLPQPLPLDNFDFIGFVFFEPTITFSSIDLRQEDFSDKMATFLEPELVKPSTINLLYGPKFGSTPFVTILGILALLFFGALVFINRRWAFISLLVFWLLFDLRYSYDQYSVLKTTYNNFIVPTEPQKKIYYDFYNLYGFAGESKKYIKGDVNFYAPREWPFNLNYGYHMYPINVTWQTIDKPYYAIFQMSNVELKNRKELFIDGKLIDPNVQLLYQFDEHSYILKKN
ncbi:MAG: hypothetical protein Q8K26_00175 [Candidatus Gracilibacteria bacterium]|nr:hypothetical protein [Candidatus Gracilibacteria bacterium]